jgi:hypothetical protein
MEGVEKELQYKLNIIKIITKYIIILYVFRSINLICLVKLSKV